ncbi:MAG: hypothetical protein HUJ55_08665, partial [Ileibacterium sp.]|nr:hypothetical protein [Ileibacterium sp.]
MKYRFLTAALTAAILLGGCSAQKTEEPSAASNTGTVVSTAEMADKITENSAVLEFIKFAEAQGMTTTEPKEANEGCALT